MYYIARNTTYMNNMARSTYTIVRLLEKYGLSQILSEHLVYPLSDARTEVISEYLGVRQSLFGVFQCLHFRFGAKKQHRSERQRVIPAFILLVYSPVLYDT